MIVQEYMFMMKTLEFYIETYAAMFTQYPNEKASA
jgi:hypothetical protein